MHGALELCHPTILRPPVPHREGRRDGTSPMAILYVGRWPVYIPELRRDRRVRNLARQNLFFCLTDCLTENRHEGQAWLDRWARCSITVRRLAVLPQRYTKLYLQVVTPSTPRYVCFGCCLELVTDSSLSCPARSHLVLQSVKLGQVVVDGVFADCDPCELLPDDMGRILYRYDLTYSTAKSSPTRSSRAALSRCFLRTC